MLYREEEVKEPMKVYLEIYVVDQASMLHGVWRRTFFNIDQPQVGGHYLLYAKDTNQKWLFPTGGSGKGEHYDTKLDAWVVWIQLPAQEGVSFENYDFSPMDRSRWPT